MDGSEVERNSWDGSKRNQKASLKAKDEQGVKNLELYSTIKGCGETLPGLSSEEWSSGSLNVSLTEAMRCATSENLNRL